MVRVELIRVLLVTLALFACYTTVSGAEAEGWRSEKDMAKFFKWLGHKGADVSALEWNAERGVIVTTRNITVNESLFVLPEAVVFNRAKLEQSSVKACLTLPDADPRVCMIVFLMYESNNEFSFWEPYINILPKDYSHIPVTWGTVALLEMQSNISLIRFKRQADGLKGEWERVRQMIEENPKVFGKIDDYTWDKWMWACFTFQTRAHQHETSDTFELLPMLDMLDHSAHANPNFENFIWDFDTKDEYFKLEMYRQVPKGEHPYLSYGLLNNIQLLDRYGFVLEDNPADYVDTGLPYLWRNDTSPETVERQVLMLAAMGIGRNHTLIFNENVPHLRRALAALRLTSLTDLEFNDAVARNVTTEFLGLEVESRVHRDIMLVLRRMLSSFPTTVTEDNELLMGDNTTIDANTRMAIINRRGVKSLLLFCRAFFAQHWLHYLDYTPSTKSDQSAQ